LLWVWFVPSSEGEVCRFIVVSREKGGEFEVINEGLIDGEMLGLFREHSAQLLL
jgi:hypothetical protein